MAAQQRRSLAVRRAPGPVLALASLMLASAVVLLLAMRHLTFFYDEWDFVLGRRGGSLATYLDPHNGHLALFPVAVYKVLFATVGLRHYIAYQLVLVALHLLCCLLLYLLVRPRLGAWMALAPTLLLLFLGSAWQDLLWPFQIGFLSSVAGGLAALLLLRRKERGMDAWASAALIWALTGSAVGVPFLVACAALILAQRSRPQRLWVIVVPAVLFVIWYVGWGTTERVTSDSLLSAPQYVADASAGAVAGLAGLSDSWGPQLVVLLAAALLISTWRRPGIRPLLLAALAGALSFWILSAVARADFAQPAASRYIYVGGVFVLLAASDCFWMPTLRPGRIAVLAILVLGCILANVNLLRGAERNLRADDIAVRASLAAVQIATPVVAASFVPEPQDAPQISSGPYLAAVHSLGSPAFTEAALLAQPESVRMHADSVLEQAERLALAPARRLPGGGQPLSVAAVFGARLTSAGPCRRATPSTAVASVDVTVQPGSDVGVQGKAPDQVYLRRFASQFTSPPFATVPASTAETLRFPRDEAPALPWGLQVVSAKPFTLCAG